MHTSDATAHARALTPQRASMEDLILSVHYEEGSTAVHAISQPVIRIGRRMDNDIVLSDNYVSGYHAELQRLESGEYEVIDQDSHNGTIVNGQKVKRARIRPGDVVVFGVLETLIQPSTPSAKVAPLSPPLNRASRRPLSPNPLAKTLSHSLRDIRQVTENQDATAELQQKLRAAEEELATLRGESAPEDARDRRAQRAIEKRQRKLAELERQLHEKSSQLKLIRRELTETAKAAENQAPLREELAALRQSHDELKERTTRLRELETQFLRREKELISIESKLAAHERNKQRRDEEITSIREELEQRRREIRDVRREREEESKDLSNLRTEMQGLVERRASLAAEITQLQAEAERGTLALSHLRDQQQAAVLELNIVQADAAESRQWVALAAGREATETHSLLAETNQLRQDRDRLLQQRLTLIAEMTRMSEKEIELARRREQLQAENNRLEIKYRDSSQRTEAAAVKAEQARLQAERRQTQCRELEEESQALQAAIETLFTERDQAIEEARLAKADLKDSVGALERDHAGLAKARQDLAAELRELEKTRQEFVTLKTVRDQAAQQARQVKEDLASLDSRRAVLKEDVEDLDFELRAKKQDLRDIDDAIDQARQERERLTDVKAELAQREQLLRELRDSVRVLKKEKDELDEKTVDLRGILTSFDSRKARVLDEISDREDLLKTKEEEISQAIDELKNLKRHLAQTEEEQLHLQDRAGDHERHAEEITAERAEQEAALEEVKAEATAIRQERDRLEQERRGLQREVDSLQVRGEEILREVELFEQTRVERDQILGELGGQVSTIQAALAEVRLDYETAEERLQKLQEEHGILRSETESELGRLQADRQRLEESNRGLREQAERASASLIQVEEQMLHRQQELGALQTERAALTSALRALEMERDQAAAESEGRRRELESHRQRLDEVTQRLRDLRAIEEQRARDLAGLGAAPDLNRLDDLLEQRKAAENELADKLGQVEAAARRLDELESKVNRSAELDAAIRRLQADLESRQGALRSVEATERDLRERVALMEDRAAQVSQMNRELAEKESLLRDREERARLLQQREELFQRAFKPELGTLHSIATDLIHRLDGLDDLIARWTRLDSEPHVAGQLLALRESMLAMLKDYGVTPIDFPAGKRLELPERRYIKIVEAKSDRPRSVIKVIETQRRGYLHRHTDGAETILRRAEVISSNA